jgi:hypothetical protein
MGPFSEMAIHFSKVWEFPLLAAKEEKQGAVTMRMRSAACPVVIFISYLPGGALAERRGSTRYRSERIPSSSVG